MNLNSGPKKKTVMVVEDFEDNRFMMRRLLEMSGYAVLEAVNGEEAVVLAVKEQPSLILMDLSLPLLDGLAATRRIRGDITLEPGARICTERRQVNSNKRLASDNFVSNGSWSEKPSARTTMTPEQSSISSRRIARYGFARNALAKRNIVASRTTECRIGKSYDLKILWSGRGNARL